MGFLPPALRRLDEAARARSPWFRDGRFLNFDEPDGLVERGGKGRFLKWKLAGRTPPAVPDAPDEPIAVRPLDPAALALPERGVRVAWLGHSSFIVLTRRLRLAVDPIFGGPPFVPRRAPPPIAPASLPPLDVVLISHNHYDHLDAPALGALRRKNPDLRAIAPLGLEGFLRALGFRDVRALDWWEEEVLEGDLRVTALPARHWSKRGIADDGLSHWCGYLLEADGRRLLYAGDTARGGHFQAIADRTARPHAALVPIGAYAPRWFMRYVHVDPEEAVEAARVLGAELLLPCHHGTFQLADEPLGEPRVLLARALASRAVAVRDWSPGEIHEV